MKRLAIALAALALLAVYPAVRMATAQTAKPSFLFVQSAQKISYKDGVMRLHDIPQHTIFFSDRPNRVVGNVPTDKFVARWTTDKGPDGFATSPPNAAVTLFQPDGAKTAIVELTNPKLDGKDLTYNVKVLQGVAFAAPAQGVVFIDNYTGWAEKAFDAQLH
jgi:hypothetical protein